ncbi:sensor domain-containing diguanylate cyclase [Enterobacillus tribolii]|uniref:Diguanylate cyclase (GGDEF)-like protein n=1 Tax=Enterobacillus tribolii TaxID=1487935 RepID=A0A370R2E9_9GAMM|nr:sensor domain-containing diguanylate cyclase [Enterobacillus tribolii]MBW7983646.1 sensor domain-containing diguanylate cyclase [Enterobacillus tribolii]RDK96574.1 diguanylate cyclase (GGDEF)-like protein [Enterobacillus tribolii]
MKTPDIPADEEYRLKELRALNILNTPAEERFDRLTRLAKRLFGVPISIVSLIETDWQWFKACDGFSSHTAPRDTSFCGHAILEDDMLIVENALHDERFFDNPLVTGEPNIRFYAGCPLRSPGGAKVGTLCIVDDKPRAFVADDAATLRDLASMAESELAAFQAATSDELTQISNRRGFTFLAQLVLNDCALHGYDASLVFIDLDKFKCINDTLGHREGDRALQDVADGMKVIFRGSDLFGRLGGDEFVALFSKMRPQGAEEKLRQLTAHLTQQTNDLQRRYTLNLSYGITAFDPAAPLSLEQLLAKGDETMYQMKQEKKR